jgi:membrane protease YdiL (CAAX protease family)
MSDLAAPLSSSRVDAPSQDSASPLFSAKRLIGFWVVAALPTVLLAWLVAPVVVPISPLQAAITYGVILLLGRVWQFALALWLIRRETGALAWSVVRERIGLHAPRHPRTGVASPRSLWRALPRFLILLPLYAVEAALPYIVLFAFRQETPLWFFAQFRAYSSPLEFVSPQLAGRWDLFLLIMLGWAVNAYLGEEFVYRGALLPAMRSRRRWLANAALYSLSYVYLPWTVPLRFLQGIFLARPVQRLRSLWPAILARGAQGCALLALLLPLVMVTPLPAIPDNLRLPNVTLQPEPGRIWWGGRLETVPQRTSAAGYARALDLRNYDLSGLNLIDRRDDFLYATFDTRTVWPAAYNLPPGFTPDAIMEIGKNPGLGVRALHAQGITGRGVGIGIIDGTLLVEHEEYAERLMWYEELVLPGASAATLHGAAVASLALGRTVGVAPEAQLYYLNPGPDPAHLDFHYYAQAVRRLLAINAQLPPENRIRVISISTGWLPGFPGYEDMRDAVAEAEAAGILVVHVANTPKGLGRPPLADPDTFTSYGPGLFWASNLYAGTLAAEDPLLAPMDSRTVAAPADPHHYTFGRDGGQSWVPPYTAGLYALAAQVYPDVTPELFWELAHETGCPLNVEHEGQTYYVGRMLDPGALIGRLKQ